MASETPLRSSAPKRSSPPRDVSNKLTSACFTCRKKKVKCTGGHPCHYCTKRELQCVVPEAGQRRVYSSSKIADLERRLARYEGQAETNRNGEQVTPELATLSSYRYQMPDVEEDQNPGISIHDSVPRPTTTATTSDPRSPAASGIIYCGQAGNNEQSFASPVSTIAADSSLSTSNVFGARVNDLLSESSRGRRYRPNPSSTNGRSNTSPVLQEQQQFTPPAAPPTITPSIPPLPSLVEANKYLQTMNLQIGRTQHHIDFRDFSDRLAFLYSSQGAASRFATPWYLEIYIVCAIAKLFTGDFGGRADSLPGWDYFDYVHRNLPILSDLHANPRLGIELLALVAVYLQNINRKEEAYIYISSALRIAISYGLHHAGAAGRYSQSEQIHLNRLWWTVYMQERRLAAATGNPPGINDETITAALPADAFGFASITPLIINIKIARITGRIIKTLYGSSRQEEAKFVPNVQGIVRDLHEIAQELPPLPESHNGADDVALKDSASLHLALYQALILTVRPIMLHVAQLILRDHSFNGHHLNISSLGRLSRTCSEAATRLLRVLTALRRRQLIGIFGFWDFDGIQCAAFIMVLAAIYDSACLEEQKINPRPAILSAFEMMQYLIDRGNSSVEPKLRELQKTWSRIETYLRRKDQASSSPSPDRQLAQPQPSNDEGPGDIRPIESTQGQQDVIDYSQNDQSGAAMHWQDDSMLTDFWSEISQLVFPPNTYEGATMAGISIDEYYSYCNSLYNSPNWGYIGEESVDFAELERHMDMNPM